MADPFVAEIRIFPFNFAPKGWAFCDGQLLPLSQNTALYALLGSTYGGDGKSTFALPDLQGRAPMHAGQGPGLTDRVQGESGGSETVTLQNSELPDHTHGVRGSADDANSADATNGVLGSDVDDLRWRDVSDGGGVAPMDLAVIGGGGNQPHNNMQPYLTLNFCIATQGVFPPRT